jgi:hypothetical protein
MTKLSRSKIELLQDCPRCFWLDVKQGVKRPFGPPYTINNAIDWLFKQEFDEYRAKGKPHPVMVAHDVDAVPFRHEKLDQWRHNFTGVQVPHKPSDFLVFGAVDDLWVNPKGEVHVVDYKATGAAQHKIYDEYRRQMEIYQWLLRGNGLTVSPVGYFVFARVNKGDTFGHGEAKHQGAVGKSGGVLPFDIFVEHIEGNSDWVEVELARARAVVDMKEPPEPSEECEYCAYRKTAAVIAAKTMKRHGAVGTT